MRRLAALSALALALSAPAGAAPDDDAEAARWVAVVPSLERDPEGACAAALEPLLAHRRAQGLDAVVAAPATDAEAARFVRDLVDSRRPDYLLLVGDVAAIPCHDVRDVATDRPYGDLDGDGYPEVAIGRLPWSDPATIRRVAERTVAYEETPGAGAWRKQLALVAGEAGFGAAADALIENLFQRVVKNEIAPGYDLDLTYASTSSAYCYPPERFAERVVSRLDEGALVFAYVGHGQKHRVDDLDVPATDDAPARTYPVLEEEHAARLDGAGVARPVFVSIACWNGCMDADRAPIGAALMAARGGPIAFLGSSRVSHPVQNALLAKELVRELLDEAGALRLGPAIDRARRAMAAGRPGVEDPLREEILTMSRMFVDPATIAREMPRHVDMYNLFGDPALVLARPDAAIAVEASPAEATAGDVVVVRGAVPSERLGAPAVTLTLEVPRDRTARPVPPDDEDPYQRYARANDKVVATRLVPVERGVFETTLHLPPGLVSGDYFVKVFAGAGDRCAVGAARVAVKADPDYDPWADDDDEEAPVEPAGRRYF